MRVVMVDDEKMALDKLERTLKKVSEIDVIAKLTNPSEVRRSVRSSGADVVFIDIKMPEISGIELAEQLIEDDPHLPIVFTTGYEEYAIKAFELNALDYLLKPISTRRLTTTIERMRREQGEETNKVPSSDAPLNIQVSHSPLFIKEGKTVDLTGWRTAKAKELFFYLLHHRGKLVHNSVLVELLWPDYEPERAYSQLYTTIYHVRKVLKELSDHLSVINGEGGYILKTTNVTIDTETWKERVEAAPLLNDSTLPYYLETMELYRGGYLESCGYEWAAVEQNNLENMWIIMVLHIGDYYFNRKEYKKAAEWYTKVQTRYPEIEEVHFSLMKVFDAINEKVLVKKQYEELKNVMKRELDVLPNEEIQQWYKKWKRHNT